MIAFQVNDMTCGHRVNAIRTAVQAVDASAQVTVDLARSRVEIEPALASTDVQALSRAITGAGYTPLLVGDAAASPAAPRRSGCCCG